MDTFQHDALTIVSDGAAAYTTSQITKVAAANKIIDTGGIPNRTDLSIVGGFARMQGTALIDVSAIDTTSSDEIYRIFVMGSNVADGTLPACLGGISLGYGSTGVPNGSAAGTAVSGLGSTTTPGRFEIHWCTQENDVMYRYLYLHLTVAGTTPSITFKAFLSLIDSVR